MNKEKFINNNIKPFNINLFNSQGCGSCSAKGYDDDYLSGNGCGKIENDLVLFTYPFILTHEGKIIL